MPYSDKIRPPDELAGVIRELRLSGDTIVQCHGCFDIVHPGHIRYLAWAAEQGDVLVVSVSADEVVAKGAGRPFVPEQLRAENLAALEMVDYVCIDDGLSAEDILNRFRPDVYVKGKEFEDDYTDRIGRERQLVESYGGRILFSSGEVVYSSTEIIEHGVVDIEANISDKLDLVCHRHAITRSGLLEVLSRFSSRRILVIGDTIVDEYVLCDSLGMSAEAPVLTVKPLDRSVYLGGAGVVVEHVASLGAAAEFLTVVGDDERGHFVRDEIAKGRVAGHVLLDHTRPTTLKTRFIAEEKKLLKVNTLKDHGIDQYVTQQAFEVLDRLIPQVDAIVMCDFCYGVITPALNSHVCDLARRCGKLVIGGVQSSTQLGNVTRFKGITLTVPSEREARLALCDREDGIRNIGVRLLQATGNEYLAITLGAKGMLVFQKLPEPTPGAEWDGARLTVDLFPALNRRPVDTMGAGDSCQAAFTLCLASGASIWESACVASAMAALAVGKLGNVPVGVEELKACLEKILPPDLL